jgi:hypothetical protein
MDPCLCQEPNHGLPAHNLVTVLFECMYYISNCEQQTNKLEGWAGGWKSLTVNKIEPHEILHRKSKINSAALVHKRNIPTEWPPLVGEVSANFLRIECAACPAQRIPTAVNLGFLGPTQDVTWVKHMMGSLRGGKCVCCFTQEGLLRRHYSRWVDNIKTYLKEIYDAVNWICPSHEWVQ